MSTGVCGPKSPSGKLISSLLLLKIVLELTYRFESGLFIGVGGPLLTAWLSPTEEELRAKYNPDLRKRSLEGRAAAEQEFDEFVTKLKEYSKSDKPSTHIHDTLLPTCHI